MEKRALKRTFIISKGNGKDIILADPNPDMTPEQVLSFYMAQYPELTSSSIMAPTYTEDGITYKFKSVTGTKG